MKFSGWSYKQKVLLLIAAIGILRSILAFIVELGNDESYYWLYSQHLKWNYFDHPPMIALWIRATTLNLWLQNYPGFIRLGSVISCCVATWLMFKCVSALSNERAGWFAACMYNAFFYAGVTAGIFALPDAPQMLFWTWSMYCMVMITQHEKNWKHWLLFGVASGLCIMSKVHGLFIWIGLGCYIVFYKRNWLANVGLYVALAISITICLPILFWNIHYDFMTWKFNGPRIDVEGGGVNWHYFLSEITGQIFKNNPLNFLFIIIGLVALKKGYMQRSSALTIFNFAGILLALTLLFVSLYKPTLAHWSGPAYVTLLPVAAIYLDQRKKNNSRLFVGLSLAMHVFVLLYCVLFINFYPGTYGAHSDRYLGLSDYSLDLYAWKRSGEKFDSMYISGQQKNEIPQNTPVICNGWWGAHIEYYFCRPQHIKMIGLGDVMDIHEYAWMNNARKDSVNLQQAFCIVPSVGFYNVRKVYSKYYANSDSVGTIRVFRNNKPAQNFYVYHLSGWKGNLPLE
jgi:hypothetical protein